MRRLSIPGGLLLAVAAAGAVFAAAPSSPAVNLAAATTTLTWDATLSHAPIAGAATLSGPSTYASDKLVIHVRGFKSGVALTERLFVRAGKKVSTIGVTTYSAKLNSKGVEAHAWTLTASQRRALKAAVKAGDTIFVRIMHGTTVATGQLTRGLIPHPDRSHRCRRGLPRRSGRLSMPVRPSWPDRQFPSLSRTWRRGSNGCRGRRPTGTSATRRRSGRWCWPRATGTRRPS